MTGTFKWCRFEQLFHNHCTLAANPETQPISLRWLFPSYFGHVIKLYMLKRMAFIGEALFSGTGENIAGRPSPETTFPSDPTKESALASSCICENPKKVSNRLVTLPGHSRLGTSRSGLAARATKMKSTAREAPTNSLGKEDRIFFYGHP